MVLYLRISSEDRGLGTQNKLESVSISNQRLLLQEFVQNDPELKNAKVTILEDDGYSGTNFDRPSIKIFLEMMENRNVNCLIVKDFSRWGRNELVVSDYIDQIFPKYQVRFISLGDCYDSRNHEGRTSDTSISFRQIMNAYYSKDLSRKVKTAKRLKAEQGDYLSPYAPFGYQKDKNNKNRLVIEPRSAEIVRYIFEMASNDNSVQKITQTLNKEQIPTCVKYKNEIEIFHPWPVIEEGYWYAGKIRQILQDQRYLGYAVYGKTKRRELGKTPSARLPKEQWIVKEGMHEPIIDKDLFDFVQSKIKKGCGGSQKVKKTHLFSKKLRCSECKHQLRRVSYKKVKYFCSEHKNDPSLTCARECISEETLSNIVLKLLKNYFDSSPELVQDKKKSKSFLPALAKSKEVSFRGIEKLQQKKMVLYESFMNMEVKKEEYMAKKSEIETKISELKAEICKKEKEIMEEKEKIELEKLNQEKSAYQRMLDENELTREMVETFVDYIYVHPDLSVEVVWNFSDINFN